MRLATCLRICIFSWIVLSALSDCLRGEDTEPYAAFAAHDRSPVRSGPGDDHYVTDLLNRGDEVEVHRQMGEWLAIRPLKSSFSWIAQREVELSEVSQVANAVGSTAVSWIGSNVEQVSSHKWMVKLSAGEPVSVLGQERRKVVADGKAELFYKIAPPSGEFRWVHRDDVVAAKEEVTKPDREVQLADFRVALSGNERKAPETRSDNEPQAIPKKDDFSGRGPEGARSSSTATTREPTDRVARSEQRTPQPISRPTDGRGIDDSIKELDSRLSLLVAQRVEKWDFAALRGDAKQAETRATTTLERARLKIFLDKIDDFESLKARHALFAPVAGAKPEAPRLGSPKPAELSSKSDGLDPRFDGTGLLLPVHSTKRSAPPYALLDKEGNILQFVSPAPGLNLHRYLRKEIGIFGQKGSSDLMDKPHLTAHRVVELDRHRK